MNNKASNLAKELPEGVLDEFRPVRYRRQWGWIIASVFANGVSVFDIFHLHGWLLKSICLLCTILLSLTTYLRWKAVRLFRRKWGG